MAEISELNLSIVQLQKGRKDEAAGYTGSWKHKSMILEVYGVRAWQISIVGKIFGYGPAKENIKVGNDI